MLDASTGGEQHVGRQRRREDSVADHTRSRVEARGQRGGIVEGPGVVGDQPPVRAGWQLAQRHRAQLGERGRVNPVWYGGDGQQPGVEPWAKEAVLHTYLPPLRDAEGDLKPGRANKLVNLLNSLAPEGTPQRAEIETVANTSNEKLAATAAVTKAKTEIQGRLDKVLGPLFKQMTGLRFADPRFDRVIGALWALDFPARRTALYSVVGPGHVATAVSLETVSMQLAKMTGPVLAGMGLAHFGPTACFAAMAVLYAVGLGISFGLGPRIGGAARPASASVTASLGAGIRAAWEEPTVRAVLVTDDGKLVGVITRKTLVREVVARGLDPRTTTVRVGVSAAFKDLRDTPRALHVARVMLRGPTDSTSSVAVFDGSILATAAVSAPEAMVQTVRAALNPFTDLPDEDREALFETFRVWQDTDASVRGAAEVLICHPNTVRHRLRRIEKRTGLSLSRPKDVAELCLAFEVHRRLM